jgi:hypothetical protein
LIGILLGQTNESTTTEEDIHFVKECAKAISEARKPNQKGERRATSQNEKLKKEILNFFNVRLTTIIIIIIIALLLILLLFVRDMC